MINTVQEHIGLVVLNETQTMCSTDVVKLINEARVGNKGRIRHDHFMDKIRKEFGEHAEQFKGIYLDAYGREMPCYYLPIREIHIMLMSENSVVRAKVYDELERLTKILRAYEGYHEEKETECKVVNPQPTIQPTEPKPAKKSILQWVAGKLTIGG